MGTTCWDRISIVGKHRSPDFWHIQERYETVGGNAPNAAANAALLGVPVHLLSALGDDRYKEKIQEMWQQIPHFSFSLETSPFTVVSDLMIFPKHRQIYCDYTSFVIRPGRRYKDLVGQAKIVDFYPVLFREDIEEWYDCFREARRARSASGLKEEAEAGRSWQIIVDSLEIVDPPEKELLEELGTELLVLTEASRGGRFWTPAKGWQKFQSPSVKEVDSVGAGDAFRGALLAGLYQGLEPRKAIDLGASAGARAAARRGGFPLGLNTEGRS